MKQVAHWRDAIQIARAMGVTIRRGVASPGTTRPALDFRGQPVLRGDACTACGVCVDECPTHCIRVVQVEGESEATTGILFEVDWKRCMCCGLCASVCPVEAIELSGGCER